MEDGKHIRVAIMTWKKKWSRFTEWLVTSCHGLDFFSMIITKCVYKAMH